MAAATSSQSTERVKVKDLNARIAEALAHYRRVGPGTRPLLVEGVTHAVMQSLSHPQKLHAAIVPELRAH